MATFPNWTLKKNRNSFGKSNSLLSPRQIANKAYTLSSKKLDRDEKRSEPHYGIRERLLISQTMLEAETLLNKRTPRHNRRVMAFEDDGDDVLVRKEKRMAAPPKPLMIQECNNTIDKNKQNVAAIVEKPSIITATTIDTTHKPFVDKSRPSAVPATICDTSNIYSAQKADSPQCYYNDPSIIAASLMTVLQQERETLMLSINAVINAAAAAEVPIIPIHAYEHPFLCTTTENSSSNSSIPIPQCLSAAAVVVAAATAADPFDCIHESRSQAASTTNIINIPSTIPLITNQT